MTPAREQIEAHLPLLGLNRRDQEWLRTARPILEAGIDGILDALYAHLLENDEIARVFASLQEVEHAKSKQRHHLLTIAFDPTAGEARFEAARRIGAVHRQLGVRPDFYVSAYGFLIERCTAHLLQAAKHDPQAAAAMVSAAQRALLWDLDAGVSAYVEAGDAGHADRLRELQARNLYFLGLSHDLRTPLNAIMGFAEMIRDGRGARPDETSVEYATIIHESAEHLLHLIDDILLLARAEAGTLTLEETVFDIDHEVEWVLRMQREDAEARQVELTFDTPGIAGLVRADRVKFRRVLLNIVGNAVKFTPSGGAVSVRAVGAEGVDLAIVVEDTGVGIAQDELDRVLEPFFRGSNPAARPFGGSGLGLAIARGIVELHGGSLSIRSQVGRGTAVSFTLPARRRVAATNPEPIEGGRGP